MKKTQIIAFSGKKQSGKNTSFNFIKMMRDDAVEFSFAEPLKRMCVDILGLEEWQAFGNDEQKNTPCPHLLWENFPLLVYDREDGKIHIGKVWGARRLINDEGTHPAIFEAEQAIKVTPKAGPMTAREVIQFWGTEIFRKQYYNVWADACIRKINKLKPGIAVITDCRFDNEFEAVQQAGGKVVRLTRHVFEDEHASEKALDKDVFDWDRFDYVLDNHEMDVAQQCEALYPLLRKWKLIPARKSKRIHI